MSIFRYPTRLFPFATYINLNPVTASNQYPYGGTVFRPMYFTRWSTAFFTATAHDGTKFYTFDIFHRTGTPATDVKIATVDTKTIGGNTQTTLVVTNFLIPSISLNGYLYIVSTKTGLPTDTYVLCPALEFIS